MVMYGGDCEKVSSCCMLHVSPYILYRLHAYTYCHAIIVIQVLYRAKSKINEYWNFQRLTGAFQQYDTGRNGNAHFTYEQYLSSVISNI